MKKKKKTTTKTKTKQKQNKTKNRRTSLNLDKTPSEKLLTVGMLDIGHCFRHLK